MVVVVEWEIDRWTRVFVSVGCSGRIRIVWALTLEQLIWIWTGYYLYTVVCTE